MPATIKEGSQGPDVTTWQNALNAAGFPVAVSGVFDSATTEATKAWQASKGLTADGIVGPMSWGAMTGVAAAGVEDKWAQYGRDALLEAWPKVTGETPSLAELQIAGAQAQLESNYGRASYQLLDHSSTFSHKIPIGPSSGVINNWGAIQGGNAADGTGYLATDSGPSHVTPDNPIGWYDHHYRIYATPAEGAEAFVKEMTIRRPTSWALMKTGDIDAWAQQMWAGKLPNGQLNKDPQTGVFGYFEQLPASRAASIAKKAANIAFTLKEPLVVKQGGPVEPGTAVGPVGPDESGDGGGLVQKGAILAALIAAGTLAWKYFTGHWPKPF